MSAEILHGDALDVLRTLESASFDALVTDPPAGIAFMGATWDDPGKYGFGDGAKRVGAPPTVNLGRNPTCQKCGGRRRAGPKTKGCTCETPAFNDRTLRLRDRDAFIGQMTPIFAEALRVLRPGAHAVVWALPRTSHWTATALEDAGFEIRDVAVHLQAQGFPKSKALLKPAAEHWILARTPGPLRALAIDTCRIGTSKAVPTSAGGGDGYGGIGAENMNGSGADPTSGRWPANVTLEHAPACELVGAKRVRGTAPHGPNSGNGALGVLNDDGWKPRARVAQDYSDGGFETVEAWRCVEGCPVAALDEQSGNAGAHGRKEGQRQTIRLEGGEGGRSAPSIKSDAVGGASRFYFCSKASTSERSEGLDARNRHPTVKPIDLMRWLCRLVTPRGGRILDCFAGSGSTGVAAAREGVAFVGIERDAAFAELARQRVGAALGPLFASVAGGAR